MAIALVKPLHALNKHKSKEPSISVIKLLCTFCIFGPSNVLKNISDNALSQNAICIPKSIYVYCTAFLSPSKYVAVLDQGF